MIRIGISTGEPEGKRGWRRVLNQVASLAFIGGVASWFFEDGRPIGQLNLIRTLGAVAWIVASSENFADAWRKRRIGDAVQGTLFLLLAFDRATHPPKGGTESVSLALFAIGIIAAVVLAGIPLIVVCWRARADERDRTITYMSATIAFGLTIVMLLVSSSLVELKLVPAFDVDPILWVGIGVWVAAGALLRWRM